MIKWQPIETAPEAEVLLYLPEAPRKTGGVNYTLREQVVVGYAAITPRATKWAAINYPSPKDNEA